MSEACFHTHFAGDPYYNMAFDERMFADVIGTSDVAHLRLYTWDRGAITIGFNQEFAQAVDRSLLGDAPVIRRVTGGRALYHDPSELTYSVALNLSSHPCCRMPSTVRDVHRQIAEGIVDFLSRLGTEASYERRSSPQNSRRDFFHKAPCFASHARYELTADGNKIVASASRFVESSMLQHGAIKIGGLAGHPALPVAGASEMPLRSITAAEFVHAARGFAVAMGESLGISFAPAKPDRFGKAELEVLASSLEQNALDRRKSIKQSVCPTSL